MNWTLNSNELNRTLEANQNQTQLCYNRRSVGQSVLVLSTHLGLKTRIYFCVKFAGLLMWEAFSHERTGLSFTMYNVQYIYILHVMTRMYIQYIQDLCQSRLSTADYALSLVSPVISLRRTEYTSQSQAVTLLLSVFRCYETSLATCYPAKIWFSHKLNRCRGCVLASRCLAVACSGFLLSCHSIL
jgi:tryptophan-rich sensory protein